ncbi:class I SAM-dependent methyltransferase [Phormidium sp. CCY1219]|uniref:class I SAM-dependent methyltransferase n=1 Tax=Phormidium sp. CCY1219 TaxID=2886104 RepID=UPI002D1F8FD1|nr:class I SAM-dependent methyltransferase [Phormidium sp. CCY1219]MEB3828485.1 class I SAM-dependent methyltransferase [Phormidium sp. CCY1219]
MKDSESRAFVTFYSDNNISPVSQDIANLEKHFQRRESLFRSIGILPGFVYQTNIIEFGPGSGHNAVYTASLKPSKYYLVDGNTVGLEQTEKILTEAKCQNFKVIKSLFEDYNSPEKFDIVWAEGCLPHQSHPTLTLKHLSKFTKLSGIFVCTTINSISYLSETIRRLLFNILLPNGNASLNDALNILRPRLSSHLLNLKGMSRLADDWIVDNIIQPLQDRKLLSVPEVITALSSSFDVYASSPRFITDWRWYKEIVGRDRGFNDNALACYYKNNLNLIDYRYVFDAHSTSFGKDLEITCSNSWELMTQIQQGDSSKWQAMFDLLTEIASIVEPITPNTALAIVEASDWLQDGAPLERELQHFPQWWGRGQQYLSLIRKPG